MQSRELSSPVVSVTVSFGPRGCDIVWRGGFGLVAPGETCCFSFLPLRTTAWVDRRWII